MGKAEQIKNKLEEAGIRYWAGDNISEVLQDGDKEQLIDEAAVAFEQVLQKLVIDTKTDPNSMDTAKRLAKMYYNELMVGRYETAPPATAFPNEPDNVTNEKYDGMLVVRSELKSVCSHHHQPVTGLSLIHI